MNWSRPVRLPTLDLAGGRESTVNTPSAANATTFPTYGWTTSSMTSPRILTAFRAGRRVPTHHWGGHVHTLWTPSRLQYKSRLTVSHRFPHQFSSHHYQLPCKSHPWRHGTRQQLGGIFGALQASVVQHNTTNHIRITPGPPVACHIRRLDAWLSARSS